MLAWNSKMHLKFRAIAWKNNVSLWFNVQIMIRNIKNDVKINCTCAQNNPYIEAWLEDLKKQTKSMEIDGIFILMSRYGTLRYIKILWVSE